jgi:hypothetical protein
MDSTVDEILVEGGGSGGKDHGSRKVERNNFLSFLIRGLDLLNTPSERLNNLS